MKDKKLKVLQLCAVGFTVQKLLLPLIDQLNKDYIVYTVCSKDNISERLREIGYNIKNIEIAREISPIKNLKAIYEIYKYLKEEQFDIIHIHTPIAGILGRIAAKLAKVPIIIYTAHGFYFHDQMPVLKKKFFMLVEKVGAMLCDYVFTQSKEDYDFAVNHRIVDRNKISVIGNGVDIGRFTLDNLKKTPFEVRREFGIDTNQMVVGIIGRVVKEKGYIEWIKAANSIIKKHKNVKFIAIGDTLESDRDSAKDEINKFLGENNLKGSIIFLGARDDVPELLSIMDIFTLPSYREGMPRSLIEAMCMGKCCIATNIRGCREEIDDNLTGFLIKVKDWKELADKIEYVIQNSDIKYKIGQNALEKARREFDEDIVIEKQLKIIHELIHRKINYK